MKDSREKQFENLDYNLGCGAVFMFLLIVGFITLVYNLIF